MVPKGLNAFWTFVHAADNKLFFSVSPEGFAFLVASAEHF